jgi:hypothetical protein
MCKGGSIGKGLCQVFDYFAGVAVLIRSIQNYSLFYLTVADYFGGYRVGYCY